MTDNYLYSNILLLEERGVGLYNYKNTIDEIFDYVVRHISQSYGSYLHRPQKIPQFSISKELTKRIDFIKNLRIVIKPIIVDEYTEDKYGVADTEGTKLVDNVLNKAAIRLMIQVNKLSGDVYEHVFYNTLYHELNHLYQLYCVMKKHGVRNAEDSQPAVVEHIKDLDREELKTKIFSQDPNYFRADYFSYLFYYIFDKFEFNAKIAGLYGDVKSFYDKNIKFDKAVEKTEAYGAHQILCRYLDAMVLSLSDKEFADMMNLLKLHGVKKVWNTKQSFLRRMKFWLDKFLKKIGKTASLYYDELTDISEIDECYIIDMCYGNAGLTELDKNLKKYFKND